MKLQITTVIKPERDRAHLPRRRLLAFIIHIPSQKVIEKAMTNQTNLLLPPRLDELPQLLRPFIHDFRIHGELAGLFVPFRLKEMEIHTIAKFGLEERGIGACICGS